MFRKSKFNATSIIGSIIVLLIISVSLFCLFQTDSPTQSLYSGLTQNLEGDAEVIIQAPVEVQIGDLVTIDVSESVGGHFVWLIDPQTPNFELVENKQRAFFSSGVPGTFKFTIACGTDNSVSVKAHEVRVVERKIAPKPTKPTKPTDPVVPPSLSALSETVDSWCTKVQSSTKAEEAIKLAEAFESVAAQIDAGALTQPYNIISATTEANRMALNGQLQAWVPFLQALQAELEQRANDGLLITPAQHSLVWKEVAKGLRYSVAK